MKSARRKKFVDKSKVQFYDYHLPVLLKETVDLLVSDPEGTYLDGTFGGGGHCAEILSRLTSGGKVVAFDKDSRAVERAGEKFSGELASGRLQVCEGSFSGACSIDSLRGKTHGFLLDLGLSSRQLDDPSRGFGFRSEAPLDMRFAKSGRSAEELVNAAKEEKLAEIIRRHGEEPRAKAIARRIIERRRAAPLTTTRDLREAVESAAHPKYVHKTLARVFQAIRIYVNSELEELERALFCGEDLLAHGGRFVVISYHSLEDRIVKNFFRDKSRVPNMPRSLRDTEEDPDPTFKLVTRKAVTPSEKEIERNPRSRSAKLRCAERLPPID